MPLSALSARFKVQNRRASESRGVARTAAGRRLRLPEPLFPGCGDSRAARGATPVAPEVFRREDWARGDGDGSGAGPEELAHYARTGGEIRIAALLY